MAKRAPRLQFTEEERASPELAPAIQKADKKIKKLEKAEAKIPKKEVKQRVVDSDGKITTRLSFEEKKPPSKLSHAAKVSGDAVLHGVHREVRQSNDGDNAGVDAANTLTEDAESAYQVGRNIHRAHELKPYRKAHRAEKKADKANVKALNQEFAQQNEGFSSNPYSRWQQKRAIKREYAAAKAGRGTANTVKASEITKKAAEKSAEVGKKAGEFVARHKKGFLIVGLIAAVFLLFTNLFSSCSLMFQGASSSIAASTYPSQDEDIRDVVDLDDILAMTDTAPLRTAEAQKVQRQLDKKRSEHERLQKLLMSLYESLADGIIDRDEYARLKQNYAGRCAECEKQMDALQETLTQIKEYGGGHREWMAQFRKHLNITELERSIVVALIDRILIYRDNRVEVRFRFADEFAWQTDILRRAQIREVV